MEDVKYVSNALANAAADAFAEGITNTLHAQQVDKFAGYAYMVSMRLAVLEKESRDNAPVTAFVPKHAPPLEAEVNLLECQTSLQLKIERNGHKLVPQGNLLKCCHCHLRRSKNKYAEWAAFACRGVAGTELAYTTEDTVVETVVANSSPEELIEITRAKAKAIRQERAAASAKRKAENADARRQAAVAAFNSAFKEEEAELEVITRTCIPFEINATHKEVLECGGFVIC